MVVQCCVCGSVKQPEGWTRVQRIDPRDDVSHGYCPTCASKALAEARAMHRKPVPLPLQAEVCAAR